MCGCRVWGLGVWAGKGAEGTRVFIVKRGLFWQRKGRWHRHNIGINAMSSSLFYFILYRKTIAIRVSSHACTLKNGPVSMLTLCMYAYKPSKGPDINMQMKSEISRS